MDISINQESVNDAAKLIMHRLVARRIGRDPAAVDRARCAHARMAQRYAGHSFVSEWSGLLDLQPNELRARLVSRDSNMVRLRSSSPFLAGAGIDFTDYSFRLRIGRAARRIVQRSLRKSNSVLRT